MQLNSLNVHSSAGIQTGSCWCSHNPFSRRSWCRNGETGRGVQVQQCSWEGPVNSAEWDGWCGTEVGTCNQGQQVTWPPGGTACRTFRAPGMTENHRYSYIHQSQKNISFQFYALFSWQFLLITTQKFSSGCLKIRYTLEWETCKIYTLTKSLNPSE